MSFILLSWPLRDAWRTATNQDAQLAVITAAFPGDVQLRYFSASDVLLDTVTHAGWDMSATNPRYLSPRGLSARSFAASAAAAYVIAAVPGGADILRADVALSGNVAASRRTNLGAGSGADGLRIVANSALPVDALPAWLSTAVVGQWQQITGTTSPAELKDFGGVALREEENLVELFSGATGGHGGNLTDNRVMMINLDADSPVWVQRRAASNPAGWDTSGATAYFPSDGRPAPRHTYSDLAWVPEIQRYYVGGRFWGSGATDKNTRDGFNPNGGVDDWDAAGEWSSPSFGAGIFLGWRDPSNGVWRCPFIGSTGYQWNPATDTWATWTISGSGTVARQGMAYSASRGYAYLLCLGDNWDSGAGRAVRSCTITNAGLSTAISFNSSAAYTDFLANAPNIHGTVAYNNDLDVFYYYGGNSGQTSKVYVITPNAGTTWDMSLLSVTGLTPPVCNGGCNDKLKYISRWRTLVLVAHDANVHFLKVA